MKTLTYKGDIADDGAIVPFRVAARDGVSPDAVARLRDAEGIALVDDPVRAQGLLIRSATKLLIAGQIAAHPDLQYVVRVGVGTDNIDMRRAAEAGVATVNTPGASTQAVARHTLSLMLAWASRTVQGTRALAAHRWPKGEADLEPVDLTEKTLGIVGYGRIGRETARFAQPHVGRILYSDALPVAGAVPLPDLLRESDIVTLHAAADREVLTPEMVALLKPGALLINTARGSTVNTAALLARMDGPDGVHAALDVFPREGKGMFEDPETAAIVAHPRFLGTPHAAASDPVTQRKLGLEGADRMLEFARRGTINPLNLPGHTLPRVEPEEPRTPAIRGILTHESVRGALAAVTGIIARHGANIRQLLNEEGGTNGGPHLAATLFDLEEDRPEEGLKIMRDIAKELRPLKRRLLAFTA